MTKIDRDHLATDVAWVAERLERERPTATPLELDRIQLRAQAQAARQGRSQAKGSLLKSRVAITAVLMLGLFTGGTGTTLALSGSSSEKGSAAQAQYPQGGGNNVLGQQEGGSNPGSQGGGNVLGQTESSPGITPQSSPGAVQGSQQVVATQGGSSLPFTGLAAIPIIILGLALLGAGALMFRSTRQSPSGA